MLNNQTIEKLKTMHLSKLAEAFADQIITPSFEVLSFEERMGLIVDAEWIHRQNNYLQRLLKRAQLFHGDACIEDIIYKADRNLDPAIMAKLDSGNYLPAALNVILTGKSGSGKSWIACALGNSACRKRYSTRYIKIALLLEELKAARDQGKYRAVLKKFQAFDLLILDEWGTSIFDMQQSRDILEIMEGRYHKASTVFASQVPTDKWYELFTDATLADAIIDRFIYDSYFIEIKGKISMREHMSRLKIK